MPLRYLDWFVLHVPKTGGTTVRAALLQAGGHNVGGGHDLLNAHKNEAAGLRITGSLRDPWTRYGSLYLHAKRKHAEGMLRRWGGGSDAFRDVLYGWTHPVRDRVSREAGTIWHPGNAESLLQSGVGLYSWEVSRMYENRWSALMATDRLAEALPELMGVEMKGKRNPANQRGEPVDYRAMYTQDMVEWVARSEAGMIERHGFSPWAPSPVAVWRR